MKLAGKIALITGASKRIGREIALTLALAGADIIIHFHRSRREAQGLKTEIERLGRRAVLFPADFSAMGKSAAKQSALFVKGIYSKIRRIDILVNNAAIFYPAPVEKITERVWDEFMTVNLKVPFFLARDIGRRMMKQKSGKIINLCDWTALRPHPDYLPYAISKAGLVAATEGLARAFAPHVQVNAVLPGPILPFEGMTKSQRAAVTGKTLLKRFGSPKDIAETVRYLVEGTDFVTGALIPVEGGALLAS